MRFIRNLIFFSLFVNFSFAQSVDIIWIEYDDVEQLFIAKISYLGLPDQRFGLNIQPDGQGHLIGQFIKWQDDDSDEEQIRAQAEREAHEQYARYEREIVFQYEDDGTPVLFHVGVGEDFDFNQNATTPLPTVDPGLHLRLL